MNFLKALLLVVGFFLFTEISAQSEESFAASILASGVLQTGQTSRIVTNTFLDTKYRTKLFSWEHYSQYTYGTLGKSGSFPKRVLENDFLTTHVLKFWPNQLLFPALFPMYETSNLRGVKDRFALSAGVGWSILKKEGVSLEVDLGLGYEINSFQITSNNDTWRLITRFQGIYNLKNSPFTIYYIAVYQPSIEKGDDSRFRSLAKINFRLNKLIGLNIVYSLIHEEFVDKGRQKNNSQLTYGINLSF